MNVHCCLQDFSDESDDVDYQPPPQRHSSTTEKHTLHEEAGPSTTRVSEPSCENVVESRERKILRHEHFVRMMERFGFSSQYEFALHVRDAGREERQGLLREFYGGTQAVEGKGKKRLTVAKAPPAKRARKLPKSVAREPGGRRRKPALEFEDSSSPPLPPLPREASENPDTGEKISEGVKSSEVKVDTSPTSVMPILPSANSSDHNRLHRNHEEQFSPSMFGTLTEGSPSVGRNPPTHCSSIGELFEEVGYHGNLEVAAAPSDKIQTKNKGGFKSLPSINIDELFGI